MNGMIWHGNATKCDLERHGMLLGMIQKIWSGMFWKDMDWNTTGWYGMRHAMMGPDGRIGNASQVIREASEQKSLRPTPAVVSTTVVTFKRNRAISSLISKNFQLPIHSNALSCSSQDLIILVTVTGVGGIINIVILILSLWHRGWPRSPPLSQSVRRLESHLRRGGRPNHP